MVLHRGLGQLKDATDRFVALSLHHQRKHFNLPFCQPAIGGRHAQSVGSKNLFCCRVWRQRVANKDFGRNVDTAGESSSTLPASSNYQTALAAYRLAVERWLRAAITLRRGTRVTEDSRADLPAR